MTKCSSDWRKAKYTSSSVLSWLSHLISDDVVRLHLSKKSLSTGRGYDRGVYTSGKVDDGDDLAVLQRSPAFSVGPGDFVLYQDGHVRTLCYKMAKGGSDSLTDVPSLPPGLGYETLHTKDHILFWPRNLYTPRLVKGLVDLKHFHETCQVFYYSI